MRALEGARDDRAMWRIAGTRIMSRLSVAYGPPGIDAVRALIAATAGGPQARRALGRFTRVAVEERRARPGILLGDAGYLLTASRRAGLRHGAPARHAALGLVERLQRPERVSRWRRGRLPELAVGRAGIAYALLDASLRLGVEIAGEVFDVLEAIARDGLDGVAPPFRQTWCNGLAGLAMLWAKAFERTGDPRHRSRALAAGRALRRPGSSRIAYACCGYAGHAYGLLALARIDPDGPWRPLAEHRFVLAVNRFGSDWPNGLLRGWPGIVCLALDLAAREPRGFPLLEESIRPA
jgi:hypothetical protein